jgi:hypothetical protein
VRHETQPGDGFRDTPPSLSLDAQFATLAARQHGVITVAQLERAGLTHTAIEKRVRAGRLHPVHRGVYAVGHPRLSREGRWMAAVLAGGEGAVLGGLSAAQLWQISRRRTNVSEVLVPRRHRPQTGIRFRYCRHLDPRDVLVHNAIPVTTVARTLVDLTETSTPDQIANVIHEAVYRGIFDERPTRAAMARANGRHRLAGLDRALELHAEGSAGTRSEHEDRFLALVASAGLPAPLTNVRARGQGFEVDFRWPGLCVEIDGPGHVRPRTARDDRARDTVLHADGYAILRFTGEEVERQPRAVLARVETALPSRPAATP